VARAQVIFADSQSTKNDVVRLLGVPESHVDVVYAAVDARFRPLDVTTLAHVRAQYHLPAQFVLSGGTLEPRKNYVRLFEAYAAARQHAPMPPLVVFGRRGWMYEDIIAAPARLGISDCVQFVDFVDDNDLPALYNLAWAFVYPSLYEGFGLPPLEALACGTPTLVSNVSSLPEVVGEAALRVAPTDTAGMTMQLQALVNDDEVRTRLRVSGPVQAQQFRWQVAAHHVIHAYQMLGSGVRRTAKV
jgi:glycosyltransferase involved in cell wall biosynthesis